MLTVGEILRKERENQNLSLEQIEKEIKIRKPFLRAVEENNWKDFPSKIYAAGVVKNYSQLLGLNTKKTLAFFYRDYSQREVVKFKSKLAEGIISPESKKLIILITAFIISLFVLYFGYQLQMFFRPPEVKIIAPTKYQYKKETTITLVGKTEKEAMITILGERVFQNEQGLFNYNYALKKGKNLITIEVVGANGKKTVIKKEFLVL